jgi:hypothetical protein
MRLGGDIGEDCHGRWLKGHGFERGGEFGLGALHESRVVGAGDAEEHGLLSATGFREFAGLVDAIGFAGDDDLAGAIEVGQFHAGGDADFVGGLLIEADDGGHGPVRVVACLLHELAALPNEWKRGLKGDDSGRGEGRELTEGQTGGGFEGEMGDVCAQEFEGDPTDKKDRGLCVFRACQFLFRSIKTEAGDVVTEQLIGFIQQGAGGWEMAGEISAHPDSLCALTGKEEGCFLHKRQHFKQLGLRREAE